MTASGSRITEIVNEQAEDDGAPADPPDANTLPFDLVFHALKSLYGHIESDAVLTIRAEDFVKAYHALANGAPR